MAQVDSRRLRSGSLSSGSDSESSGGDNRPARMKSAIVQMPPSRLKPTLSPAPSDDDDSHSHSRHSSHTNSPPPRKKRRNLITPSPPSHNHRQSPQMDRRRGASPPRSRGYSPRQRGYSPRRRDDRRRERPRRTPPPQSSSESEEQTPSPKRKREEPDPLMTRTGGAYIPPARLRMMQEGITDKSSVAYQRLSWEALKKSINGLINKINVSNIDKIVPELFEENVVRGRGLLARSVIQAQTASPMFSHVYSALVAVINTKFPQTGELICKRLILQFRRGFKRNDKTICMTAVKFLAHLVNQQVLHELVALEVLALLMEEPTDDSVEVAVGFIKECGLKLTDVSPRGIHAMFETLRSVLNAGKVSSRIQYMIEVLFAIRKDKFKDHPAVIEGLDLVEEDDQITHLLSLADEFDGETELNVFHQDPEFIINEEKYKVIKAEILGDESGSEEGGSSSSEGEESSEDEEEEEDTKMEIEDMTDAKVLALRRTIYLTIMSSANYEECVHKLLRKKEEGSETEIANMVIECCSQERSYLRFYGLLAQRLCLLNQAWVAVFDEAFQQQYATVHRLETNKLRNTARLFAQLFYSDALPWTALSCVHLNEEETNSSSRIFVKIMFQELSEFMGMTRLNERLRDPLLLVAFEGLLPRDNPKNTRFAINFFTSIGLGGLTDDLREHLKNMQKMIMEQKQDVSSSDTDSDSSEEEEDSSSDDSSTEDSSSEESSSSEEERRRSRHSRKHHSHNHHSRHASKPDSDDEMSRRSHKKSPERRQRKKRSDSSERQHRKSGGVSPERKRKSDSPQRPQSRSESHERHQRKKRDHSPEQKQRRRRNDSSERQQRRRGRREGSEERSQRKTRGDSVDRTERDIGGERKSSGRERSSKRRNQSPERQDSSEKEISHKAQSRGRRNEREEDDRDSPVRHGRESRRKERFDDQSSGRRDSGRDRARR